LPIGLPPFFSPVAFHLTIITISNIHIAFCNYSIGEAFEAHGWLHWDKPLKKTLRERWQMKKERVVGLCICVVLLGSIQSPRLFGRRQSAAVPSLPRTVWAVASGELLTDLAYSRIGPDRHSDPLSEFVCTGWPPLGILYNEVWPVTCGFRHTCNRSQMAEKRLPEKGRFKEWFNRGR
jgi:hypothetical protein